MKWWAAIFVVSVTPNGRQTCQTPISCLYSTKEEEKKCESTLPMRREQAEAQPVQSDGQAATSAITNEMIESQST